jgi:hypothetical protein
MVIAPTTRMLPPKALIGVVVTAVLVCLGGTGAKTQSARRQGGPLDWSHGRVVESRRGANDQRAAQDWRTYRKRVRMDAARAQQRRALLDLSVAPPAPTGFRIVDPDRPETNTHPPVSTEPELDWNLRTGGYGSVVGYPAKYNWDIAASNCSDVMYFTVDQAGAASTVNVIAITRPYAGCTGNSTGKTPTVKWGLRMGTGTATSPVPSMDGEILYVLESRTAAAGGLILHAINVDNVTSNVGTYNFTTNVWSNAHTLSTSTGTNGEQLFQLTFSGVYNNLSSPFLDYATNQMFFGDSTGKVHRVINVDSTSASRDTTNFPVSCGTKALQSPVYVNGQIIVTSTDGKLYRIDMTKGAPYTCVGSIQGGDGTTTGGALSPPTVDVTNGNILVATNDDIYYGLRGVGVFDLMFQSGDGPVSQALTGAGESALPPVAPVFDEDFWSLNSGNIYVAGGPSQGNGTFLLRIPYDGQNLGTSLGYANLARSGGGAASVATSPITEFLTASSSSNPDFIYIGGNGGNYTYLNRISSKFAGTVTSPLSMTSTFAVTGGVSSGISIDTRTTSTTGATATANVYFGTAGVGTTTQSTIVQLAQAF